MTRLPKPKQASQALCLSAWGGNKSFVSSLLTLLLMAMMLMPTAANAQSACDATTEITDAASVAVSAKEHEYNTTSICSVSKTADPRYAQIAMDGITIESITDDGKYPWEVLDLSCDELKDLGIPAGSKGLMSINKITDNDPKAEKHETTTTIQLNSDKPFVFSFDYGTSSYLSSISLNIDGKYPPYANGCINQFKLILSAGSHTLYLQCDNNSSDVRAFIYNLQASTSFTGYAGEYATDSKTLTLKAYTDAEVADNIYVLNDGVSIKSAALGIEPENIVIDESFNTFAPTSLDWYFANLSSLKKVTGLGNINTTNVTNMNSVFAFCEQLTEFDIDKLNTANVEYMYGMFHGCSSLEALDLSGFNTDKVISMSMMFCDCHNLKSIKFGDNFNTSLVQSMGSMFMRCYNLESLDLLSFNTANVTDMSDMFNMENQENKLKRIFVGEEFSTSSLMDEDSSNSMFKGCNNLPNYKADEVDKTHANYKSDGYFLKLIAKNGDEKVGAAGDKFAIDKIAFSDDKDFTAYDSFTATAVSYSRTFSSASSWATLCLPFAVNLDGQNFRAFTLLSATDDVIQLQELQSQIAAGTPVIIKINEGETQIAISESDKDIATQPTSSSAVDSYQLVGLYAKKIFSRETDNDCYILKGSKMMNPAKMLENTSTSSVGSMPFRAYLKGSDTTATGAKAFSLGIGGDATAIDTINAAFGAEAEYYDLQGHRLAAPQQGINIVKRAGKAMKLIIRN